jgi:hypothetical protein
MCVAELSILSSCRVLQMVSHQQFMCVHSLGMWRVELPAAALQQDLQAPPAIGGQPRRKRPCSVVYAVDVLLLLCLAGLF